MSRDELLYEVASLYYERDLDQEAIAKRVGLGRSMISRLLTEARRRGIVSFTVHRPAPADGKTARELIAAYGLQAAAVVPVVADEDPAALVRRAGAAAARLLEERLTPGLTIGLGWGTSISALVEHLQPRALPSTTVVQLIGALGAREGEFDGPALVRRLAEKLGGEAAYLHAPFMVDSARTARALIANPGVRGTVALFARCGIAISGIGSTEPSASSYHRAGYVPRAELELIRAAGAVGDVCGRHIDAAGRPAAPATDERIIAIGRAELAAVPLRLGIAA